MTTPQNVGISTEITKQLDILLSAMAQNYFQQKSKAPTFAEFADEWLQIRVDNGNSADNTVSYYTNLFGKVRAYFGSMEIDKIRPMDIEKFLNLLTPDYAPATVYHYFRILKCIFKYAEINDVVQKNVMQQVRPPRQCKRMLEENVDYLSNMEARIFLKALDTAPLRWQCMMKVLIQTGIRRGEACGLIWEDVDIEKSRLLIRRNVTYSSKHGVRVGKLKTAHSFRSLPISKSLLQELLKWKEKQFSAVEFSSTAFIFSRADDIYTPMFPTAPTKWLARFTKKNGLPTVSPHDLRHTCGTLMMASGASVKDVQDTLGHADASTTLNYYVGANEDALKRASNRLAISLGIE